MTQAPETLALPPKLAKAIIEHARDQFPLEACGLLAGKSEGPLASVEEVYPLPNLAKSRRRFDIGPHDQLKAVKDMRAKGLRPLGNYHSHPETPARPSEEDLKLFLDPSAAYLIVSLAERVPKIKAFKAVKSEGGPGFSEVAIAG
jgi:proteasome lid subunit RPN8/RPN11